MSTHSARRRGPAATILGLLFSAPWLWVVGCVYDADDRCSPGQVVVSHDRCACASGLVAVDGLCQPCPEHELEQNGACVCEQGYARADETGPCLEDAPGLGLACSNDADCVEQRFTHCQPDPAGDYCTNEDCATTDDCAADYACDIEATPTYCKRPPLGQGAPCESSADCADYEATYCEVLQGNVCLVQGCADGSVECFIGWQCCDLTAFGLPMLCVPEGECPS